MPRWVAVRRTLPPSILDDSQVIKAEAMLEYGEMMAREALVWFAAGPHPHIAQLRQVYRSASRMYFISGASPESARAFDWRVVRAGVDSFRVRQSLCCCGPRSRGD
jgi:hypothetical protein